MQELQRCRIADMSDISQLEGMRQRCGVGAFYVTEWRGAAFRVDFDCRDGMRAKALGNRR